MQTETTTTATETQRDGLKIRPIGWEETKEILRPLFKDRRHWILVCHIQATELIQQIERRHYLGDRNGDFTLITGFWRGQIYALCAMKKKHMRSYQFASLLRQMIRFKISDAEMMKKDLVIPAPPRHLDDALALAAYIFDGPADLAMGA